jgi:CheY-like chemotaxis protein
VYAQIVGEAAQRTESSSESNLAGRTVLIIEDHPDSLQLLTTVLESLRAHVVTARTIEEAERRLGLHVPQLIVCDMKLPDGTGLDFIRWLRHQPKRLSKTPCIAVTGWDQYFPPDRATGFDAYMRKPINLDRFCVVAVALAHS